LYDANETPRIAADVSADGAATLGVAHRDRKTTISLTVGADGHPSLDLTDQEGKPRATLGYPELGVALSEPQDKREVPSLMVYNQHGEVVGEVP
jgi:hypothetical protein